MREIKVKLAPVLQKSGAMAEADNLRNRIINTKDELTRAKIYYVSNNGDDNNDGLSPETPFKTLDRVNAIPGGQYLVRFERGSTFRLTDTYFTRGHVYYAAYGEGPKPQFLGSVRDYADASLWNKDESDLWVLDLKSEYSAGLINFNNDKYIGVKKYEFEQIAEDGDFYHDNEKGKLYLKLSNGNPGEVFQNIEIGTVTTLFNAWNVNNVRFDNLCLKYGISGGINAADCGDINITNCEFSWIGGKYFSGPHRYGNAVEFWYRAYNSSVKNCWFNQIFDAALTYQGSGPSETIFKDIHFENNLIEYCSMNFEFWTTRINSDGTHVPGGKMHGMRFVDNILRGAGYGWGGVQRPSKPDQAFLLSWDRHFNNDDMKNFYITDNIFDCADCNMVYCLPPSKQDGFFVRHNKYYQKKPTGINSHSQIIRSLNLNATNQEEFEYAIKQFEEKPDHVEWLED